MSQTPGDNRPRKSCTIENPRAAEQLGTSIQIRIRSMDLEI